MMKHSELLKQSLHATKEDKRLKAALKGLNAASTARTYLGKLEEFVEELKEVDDGSRGDEECIVMLQSLRSMEQQVNTEPQNAHYYIQDVFRVLIPQMETIIKLREKHINQLQKPAPFKF